VGIPEKSLQTVSTKYEEKNILKVKKWMTDEVLKKIKERIQTKSTSKYNAKKREREIYNV
jgi:hypothetical protein